MYVTVRFNNALDNSLPVEAHTAVHSTMMGFTARLAKIRCEMDIKSEPGSDTLFFQRDAKAALSLVGQLNAEARALQTTLAQIAEKNGFVSPLVRTQMSGTGNSVTHEVTITNGAAGRGNTLPYAL